MLHSSAIGTNDPEGLVLLKQRYNAQHYALIKFYYECSNLKYLTSLISVPKLPQDPPNLQLSDSPPMTPNRKVVKDTPPATPEPDWAAQQREIATKQREYELEQQRLQQHNLWQRGPTNRENQEHLCISGPKRQSSQLILARRIGL